MTRRAVLVAAVAVLLPLPAYGRRRRKIIKGVKLMTKPPPVDNQPHVVRTISIQPRFDELWEHRIGK